MLSAQATQTSSLSVTEVSLTFGNGRVSECCFMPTEWCANGTGPPCPPARVTKSEPEPSKWQRDYGTPRDRRRLWPLVLKENAGPDIIAMLHGQASDHPKRCRKPAEATLILPEWLDSRATLKAVDATSMERGQMLCFDC